MADIKIAGRIKAGAADGISGYASEILFDDAASNKTVKEKIEEVASSPQTMIVTITPDGNDGYEADKTFAEIAAFIDNGGTVIAKDEEDGDSYYYLDNYIASEVVFTRNIWGSGGFSTRYYTIDNTDTVSFDDSVHHISSDVNSSSTANLANSAAVKAVKDDLANYVKKNTNDNSAVYFRNHNGVISISGDGFIEIDPNEQGDVQGNGNVMIYGDVSIPESLTVGGERVAVESDIPDELADLAGDSTHRTVTDAEKATWNGKQNALTFDNVPTANSDNPVKSGGVYQAIQSIDVSSQISGKEDKSNKVTSFSSPTDTQYPSAKLVSDQLATKQGTISDLSTIRSNAAAGATAYQKPGTGIPSTDLASAVQTSLGKADTAIQSVTVGTTTTGAAGSSASVTNTGTATAPVLSFTIPQGAQGIQGIQGPQGERGLPGESGVTGDVSGFTVIQTIDPSATYGATDIAGAATVQATNAELTELEGELDEIEEKFIIKGNEQFVLENSTVNTNNKNYITPSKTSTGALWTIKATDTTTGRSGHFTIPSLTVGDTYRLSFDYVNNLGLDSSVSLATFSSSNNNGVTVSGVGSSLGTLTSGTSGTFTTDFTYIATMGYLSFGFRQKAVGNTLAVNNISIKKVSSIQEKVAEIDTIKETLKISESIEIKSANCSKLALSSNGYASSGNVYCFLMPTEVPSRKLRIKVKSSYLYAVHEWANTNYVYSELISNNASRYTSNDGTEQVITLNEATKYIVVQVKTITSASDCANAFDYIQFDDLSLKNLVLSDSEKLESVYESINSIGFYQGTEVSILDNTSSANFQNTSWTSSSTYGSGGYTTTLMIPFKLASNAKLRFTFSGGYQVAVHQITNCNNINAISAYNGFGGTLYGNTGYLSPGSHIINISSKAEKVVLQIKPAGSTSITYETLSTIFPTLTVEMADSTPSNVEVLYDLQVKTESISGIPSSLSRIQYQGVRPPINQTVGYFAVQKYFNNSSNTGKQGAACYGKYLFQFTSGAHVEIYDMEAKTLLDYVQLPVSSSLAHNDTVSFGSQKVDVTDEFPIVYVSGSQVQMTAPVGYVWAYRIVHTQADTDNNIEESWTFTLVQTITTPAISDVWAFPDVVMDNHDGTMWIMGWNSDINNPPANDPYGGTACKFTKFKVPKLSEGSEVTLLWDNAITSFVVNNMHRVQQGCLYYNGLIYVPYGVKSSGYQGIDIVSIDETRAITNINLYGTPITEPEAVVIYNGELYIPSQSNDAIWKLYFE